jgi:hypothetical protein
MCDACGPEPSNPRNRKWWRWEFYQRHGTYPPKPKTPQAAVAPHPVASVQFIGDTNLSSQYDENGRPWEDHEHTD